MCVYIKLMSRRVRAHNLGQHIDENSEKLLAENVNEMCIIWLSVLWLLFFSPFDSQVSRSEIKIKRRESEWELCDV